MTRHTLPGLFAVSVSLRGRAALVPTREPQVMAFLVRQVSSSIDEDGWRVDTYAIGMPEP